MRADLRQAGDWYISVASPPDSFVNFSLIADLVESPVIDKYIPLDADAAAAERCGRFCVVLPDWSPPPPPPYWLSSAPASRAPGLVALLLPLALSVAFLFAR